VVATPAAIAAKKLFRKNPRRVSSMPCSVSAEVKSRDKKFSGAFRSFPGWSARFFVFSIVRVRLKRWLEYRCYPLATFLYYFVINKDHKVITDYLIFTIKYTEAYPNIDSKDEKPG
jgi:hypothetical protein